MPEHKEKTIVWTLFAETTPDCNSIYIETDFLAMILGDVD